VIEIVVPSDRWESDDQAVVTVWLARDGATVAAGDLVAEIMCVKTQHEIRSPADGILTIVTATDSIVSKGDVMARVAS